MSKLSATLLYIVAGAILATGLMFILRPSPSLSQRRSGVTLDSLASQLNRIEGKIDQIAGEVARIYRRTQ